MESLGLTKVAQCELIKDKAFGNSPEAESTFLEMATEDLFHEFGSVPIDNYMIFVQKSLMGPFESGEKYRISLWARMPQPIPFTHPKDKIHEYI